MRATSLRGKHALVLAVAFAGSIPYGKAALTSVALGGGIQIVNLWALERGVAGMLGLALNDQGGAAAVLLQLRWVLLLGLVAAVLFSVPVAPIPFVAGLSTLVPAVIWHGLTRDTSGQSGA